VSNGVIYDSVRSDLEFLPVHFAGDGEKSDGNPGRIDGASSEIRTYLLRPNINQKFL